MLPSKGSLPNAHRSQYQGSNLSPQSGVQSNLHELGEEGWYAEALAGQVLIGGFGKWPFVVRCGKGGFSTGTSWTVDPSPLEGIPCSGSGHVLVLWFHGRGREWVEILVLGVT